MISFQNPLMLSLLLLLPIAARFIIGRGKYSRRLGVSRVLIIGLLVLAAASPAIIDERTSKTTRTVNVLVDNTTSTEVLRYDAPKKHQKKVFASGKTREIFSNAAKALDEGSYNLLITDGQTRERPEELISAAREKNATISFLEPENREEAAVRIQGPSTTVPEAKNSYTVDVSTTKDPVSLKVSVNGEEIYSGKVEDSYSFERSFDSEGDYIIRAEIESEDVFPENNQHYKTVEVREKPEILLVGEKDSLEEELKDFYDVEARSQLPEQLEDYYSIILKKKLAETGKLREYIVEGNGLVYTGDMPEKSWTWLPVKKSDVSEKEAGAKVILLIDVSTGTGTCVERVESICLETSAKGGTAKKSVRIAYSIVDALDRNNKVGVVSYNRDSYLVNKPVSLASGKDDIMDKISRLQTEGPSFHDRGLKGAASLAEENDTVVMLTDGEIGDYEENRNVPQKLRDISGNMEAKLITVGMGEGSNSGLLQDIAERTGGYYLKNSEAGRLKFRFGAGGGNTDFTPVKIVNPGHFITRGVEMDGGVNNFRPAETKSSAELLASGSNGDELLSVWRYGLGRVAAFTGGKKSLGSLLSTDSSLISKTVSWSVGNPQRKKESWIEIKDTFKPLKPEVKASYKLDGLDKVSDNLFEGELPAPKAGSHEWNGESYSYNYNPEISSVGFNRDKTVKIAQETGGQIFKDAEGLNLEEKAGKEQKTVRRSTSLSIYFLVAALVLFLVEVGYRKRKGRL